MLKRCLGLFVVIAGLTPGFHLPVARAQSAASASASAESMAAPTVTLYKGPDQAVPTRVGVRNNADVGPNAFLGTPANIVVTYTGFTVAAQTAFEAAVTKWEQVLYSPVPIRVSASFADLGDPNALGQAGATFVWKNFAGAPLPDTFYPDALADALGGVDRAPNEPDIEATFNTTFANWYFGTDGLTPVGKVDFVSAALHELGHGLGFVGSMTVSSGLGTWGLGNPSLPMVYDRFAQTGDGTPLLNQAVFPKSSAALANALQGNNLFFDWRNATRQAGGYPGARLHAPAGWVTGSSYSHLSETTYPAGNPNSLMTPALASGEVVHDPGPITRGIFRDMGWPVNDLAPFLRPPTPDFINDGSTDIAVFRPGASAVWYIKGPPAASVPWGAANDIPVPGDYDGDGTTDLAVFRPSEAVWYVKTATPTSTPWGAPGDIPVPGDYDGNGSTDLAVFRPSTGVWYLRTTSPTAAPWGTSGDVPVPGDYDGNGSADLAVFRPSTGVWYLKTPVGASPAWGTSTDIPVPGDYDGNGTTDVAVFRPSTGVWYLRTPAPASIPWGVTNDVPAPGDYDGNGTTDLAVFRPGNAVWYIRTSPAVSVPWGVSSDIPLSLPNAIRRFYFPF